MGTRGLIGFERPDGQVECNYVGSSAYLSWTGRMLHEHYNSPTKAAALVRWDRQIEALEPTKAKTCFYDPGGWGEEARRIITMENFLSEDCGWQYRYLFTNGEWTVIQRHINWTESRDRKIVPFCTVSRLGHVNEEEYVAIIAKSAGADQTHLTIVPLGASPWNLGGFDGDFSTDAHTLGFTKPIQRFGFFSQRDANTRFPLLSDVRATLKKSKYDLPEFPTSFYDDDPKYLECIVPKRVELLLKRNYTFAFDKIRTKVKEYA
jgi:hypothetical protein